MRQRSSRAQRLVGEGARRPPVWLVGILSLSVVTMLLSGCGSDANQPTAQANKAKLDAELYHAQTVLGMPQSMLAPIEQKEAQAASGVGGWNYNYADAATNYALLYNQLTGLEQTAGQTLQKQAQTDLSAFSAAVQARRSDGFAEIGAYQARFDSAVQQLAVAKTPGDYLTVDTTIRAQTEALNALMPAYQQLANFQTILHDVSGTGINAILAQSEYNQDVEDFTNANTAAFYGQLTTIIEGQITQLMADQSEAMPYVGSALLDSLQGRIQLLKQYGQDTSAYTTTYQIDARKLTAAHTLADYLALAQSINTTAAQMQGPLARGKAYADLSEYNSLVNYASNLTITDPADGQKYPAAYEYMYGGGGSVQDLTGQLGAAQTTQDYESTDNAIYIQMTDLRAMIDNMSDATPHWMPHKTDLELMQDYGLIGGKVIIVSLREQTMRIYDNGTLVFWSYVTSGRPELPSPPGLHYAMYKEAHIEFTSAEPPGSPYWYAPTPINYAIAYADGGFFVHDAWWRSWFGPDSNLPHYDPAAFNGGSHGCVNLPLNNMAWVYNWTPVGTPILLY